MSFRSRQILGELFSFLVKGFNFHSFFPNLQVQIVTMLSSCLRNSYHVIYDILVFLALRLYGKEDIFLYACNCINEVLSDIA